MSSQGRPPNYPPPPPSPYPPGSPQGRRFTNRHIAVAAALILAVLLVLTVVALVVGLAALNRDVEAVSSAAPASDSVGTDALQDGAVTADKLAGGAVTADALADGAVTGAKVAQDSLTGASIDESTLEQVPSAKSAKNAAKLGGQAASRYLSALTLVQAQTGSSTDEVKGPVTASCPAGTIVIAGGASLDGTTSGIALVESAPAEGQAGWTARAQAFEPTTTDWRIVVTAICATGGS